MREVRADVGDTEDVDEEFAEFVHLRCVGSHRVLQPVVARASRQPRMLVAHRADAGGRGGDDRVVLTENLGELSHTGDRLVGIAGVGEHLAAAGLLDGELDLDAESLEEQHGRPGRTGPHRVVEAGGEQGDPHHGCPDGAIDGRAS